VKPKKFRQAVVDLFGKEYGARRWFCGVVGCDERTAARWFSGDLEVPRFVISIIALLQEIKRLTGKLPEIE
jgi:hypothetical protein